MLSIVMLNVVKLSVAVPEHKLILLKFWAVSFASWFNKLV
jgi:hypothetical protein